MGSKLITLEYLINDNNSDETGSFYNVWDAIGIMKEILEEMYERQEQLVQSNGGVPNHGDSS